MICSDSKLSLDICAMHDKLDIELAKLFGISDMKFITGSKSPYLPTKL